MENNKPIPTDLAAPSAPEVHPSLALESSEMPYRIFTDSSRIWMDDSDGGSLFAYVREGAAPSAPAEVEGLVHITWPNKGGCGLAFTTPAASRTQYVPATALTAMQAENERLRGTAEFWENCADLSEKRSEKAEGVVDALISALREIEKCTSEHGGAAKALKVIRDALAAHAKLKGEV